MFFMTYYLVEVTRNRFFVINIFFAINLFSLINDKAVLLYHQRPHC